MATSKLAKEILIDIENTIAELRKQELLRDENGIAQRNLSGSVLEITYSGKNDASKILFDKHISCAQVMDTLLSEQQYTVLFYDKSLILAEFQIQGNNVIKERLLFVKKQNKIWKKEEIAEFDAYDEDWLDEESGIPIMMRVDFDPAEHKECAHPAAHLTLSNQECCRIPMKEALSFSEFVRFVLLHFYDEDLATSLYRISGQGMITEAEKKMIHINWE